MVKAIVGANWGDEGKGKVTDLLAQQSDVVIRFRATPSSTTTAGSPCTSSLPEFFTPMSPT